jgi:YegS/Rv2252/BmrU family lipid kinase
MKIVAIVNPVAGLGMARRKWPRLLDSLGAAALRVETRWTEGPGHAERLAAEARAQGCERVVVAGGDGTLSEALNGMWWEPRGTLPSLGLVPIGTGCDYARNFDLGRSLREKLATAVAASETEVDVGRCRLAGTGGEERTRVFLNVLGFGFDSAVIERFGRRRLKLGGRLPYFMACLQELARAASFRVRGAVDGEPVQAEALIWAAGLGRSFGGGMMITPGGVPGSGRFQVVWGGRLTRFELLRLLGRIHRGRHLSHPKVSSRYARRLEIEANPPACVEAEGELIGRTPVAVDICPRSLRVACIGLGTGIGPGGAFFSPSARSRSKGGEGGKNSC